MESQWAVGDADIDFSFGALPCHKNPVFINHSDFVLNFCISVHLDDARVK